MLSVIADIGLFACQTKVWALIGLIGFFAIDRVAFGRALLLVGFTMIYNTELKYLFQEPLPAPMDGWAFPSGHMHTAVVFWGWLAIEARRFWITIATIVLLIFTGYGLVYAGYHYPRDILGSVGFGCFTLGFASLLTQIRIFQTKPYLLGIPLFALGGLLILIMPTIAKKPHIWQGFWGIALLSLLWYGVDWFCHWRLRRHPASAPVRVKSV